MHLSEVGSSLSRNLSLRLTSFMAYTWGKYIDISRLEFSDIAIADINCGYTVVQLPTEDFVIHLVNILYSY